MAVDGAARVKASQIRKRAAEGKPLTQEQRRFLDDYSASVAIGKARSLPPGVNSSAEARERASSMSYVQSTEAQNDNVSPSAFTWSPTVPKAPDDAPPAPEGAGPEATAGAPVVDGAAPQGDPKAAAQAAVLVALITKAGIAAALELLADRDVPADMLAIANDPTTQNELVGQVAAAAHRLALKYNVQSVPMSDELVVGGAVAASAAAWLAVRAKRKKATQPATVKPPPTQPIERSKDPSIIVEPEPAKGPVRGLWSSS